MKAKEYFKKYKERPLTEKWEVSFIKQLEAMFQETKQVMESRNAKGDSAIISVFNEMNKKANAFIRMVNEADNRGISHDGFKIFIKDRMPDFAETIGWN